MRTITECPPKTNGTKITFLTPQKTIKLSQTTHRHFGAIKRDSPLISRHCFAAHGLALGAGIRFTQQLLGHSSIKTTMIYTHVSNKAISRIQSPLDRIFVNQAVKTDRKCNNFVLLHS